MNSETRAARTPEPSLSCPNCDGSGIYDDCTCSVCEGEGELEPRAWDELVGKCQPEPDTDAVERAAPRMYEADRPLWHVDEEMEAKYPLVWSEIGEAHQSEYRDLARAALTAAGAAPDLDAELDSVHPEATIDTLITYDDGTWAVTITHPVTPVGSHGQSLSSLFTVYDGTGPTRATAILAACWKAREASTD